MFFELHDEWKIGFKLLSDADLGRSSSHQTHIGLSESVLSFLSDRDTISEDSIFVYEDSFDYIDAYFDRIENPDGTYRSPKIKTGGRDVVSVTSTIRNIVKNDGNTSKWFLFWFGLKNEKIVFLLLNDKSNDYAAIKRLGLDLGKIGAGAKILQGNAIHAIIHFIEVKLNKNGLETLKELEVVSQTGIIQPLKRFGKYDIDKANANFKEIGKKGELLINEYLSMRVQRNEIQHFTWWNKSREGGMPYDFSIQLLSGNVVNLDVKTTKFDFNQKMVFSSQEVDFIAATTDAYSLFRVYYNAHNCPHLRICDDCKEIAEQLCIYTADYRKNLAFVQTDLQGAKLAVSPENRYFKFRQAIPLSEVTL